MTFSSSYGEATYGAMALGDPGLPPTPVTPPGPTPLERGVSLSSIYAQGIYGRMAFGFGGLPAVAPAPPIVIVIPAPLKGNVFVMPIGSIEDVALDWSKDIAGDPIPNVASSSWTISPTGPAVIATALSTSGFVTALRIAGLRAHIGQVYRVRNDVMTASGREESKTFRLLVVANNLL